MICAFIVGVLCALLGGLWVAGTLALFALLIVGLAPALALLGGYLLVTLFVWVMMLVGLYEKHRG